MNATWGDKFFSWPTALDHPVTLWAVVGILGTLVLTPFLIRGLRAGGVIGAERQGELWLRWKSWLWLAGAILGAVLLGAGWTMAAVGVLSWLCFREFARATGLFRERAVCGVVLLGIVALIVCNIDELDRMFFGFGVLTVGAIAIISLPSDRPKGYLQRVALGITGFLLFGYSFGYLGLMANHADYRPLLILVLLSVELNDIFAYCAGRLFGRRKLLPNTSPGKTVAGSLGALLLTTGLVVWAGRALFAGTPMARWELLVCLGVIISVLGQLGDLLLSAVKRDLGLKDFSASIAGHGGWLDRFDSLVLVPPAVYYFLCYYLGPINTTPATTLLAGGG